jgi:two-component system chemotaxis response regulator CheB
MKATDPTPAFPLAPVDAIVLGASAGGVEALLAILSALPASFVLPMVAVLHIPRNRPSLLVKVLGARARIAVREAEDKDVLLPGMVIGPPDYHVLLDIDNGCRHAAGAQDVLLSLSNDELVCYCRPSIDVLFQSAAEVLGPRVAGVILTGANADGALGLRAIREYGGLCAAQAPEEAAARAMPDAAIARARPQLVAPLAGITQWILALGAHRAGGGVANAR